MDLDAFVSMCRSQQSGLAVDVKRFFEGVIALPLEQERLLQAYIAHNLELHFATSGELILYEHPLPTKKANQGKPDLIFKIEGPKILIIETKYLTEDTGRTATKRRNKKRGKVVSQAQSVMDGIITMGITRSDLRCGVFSNDELVSVKAKEEGLEGYSISNDDLENWREKEYQRLFKNRTNVNISNILK